MTKTMYLSQILISYTGLAAPAGDCDAGFYCPGGDDVPNPVATPCPIGLHCPVGSGQPVPCDPGYFTNFTQAPVCLECIAGFYCVPEEVIAGECVWVGGGGGGEVGRVN